MSRATGTSPLTEIAPEIVPDIAPEITVDEREYETLSALAAAAVQRMPDVAGALLAELDRATVVECAKLPPGIVRLGSRVTYQAASAAPRQVTLVLPSAADISAGRVSILTPIGAALFGLGVGQTISWTARDGRQQRLRIIAVHQPSIAGA